LDLVGPTRRVAQTGILRFMMEIFVYKWLLLVIPRINNWWKFTNTIYTYIMSLI